MMQRTTKLLIGKDIDRDAQVVAGASMATIIASGAMQDGEVVVLDKNKNVLAAGATVTDSDIIYIAQGTGTTYSYTNEAGTLTSTNRKLIFSDPIQGSKVKSYKGESYNAPVQQVDTWTPGTFVAGTEYVIRIIYKDMVEHPGQFTQTYRHIATTAVTKTELDLMTPAFNAHTGRRVTFADNDTAMTFTALAVPEGTTALTDIDSYKLVSFDVVVYSVNATTGVHSEFGSVAKTLAGNKGSGYWADVRDIEKSILGYRGVTNFTHWPIITPDFQAVKDARYDIIVIESDKSYLSPDNQYVKDAPLTTIIALCDGALQTNNILGQLNPWMASVNQTAINL